MDYTWRIKEKANLEIVNTLSKNININATIANLLVNRGVDTFQKAKEFFRPESEILPDPFLMKDMDEAVRRMRTAIENEEKILVYGDYDVDGTTAVAMFYGFFAEFYPNIDYYIPDRYSEGYGISEKGVRYAVENHYKLIVSLDCGIKAIEKVALAKHLGVDFIICDHHTPGAILPDAVAVLDPKREDCFYPFKELSGCGVGFKFIQAYSSLHGHGQDQVFQFLDLVAISIAADIVPIIGENRILARLGLDLIKKNPRIGIKARMLQCNLKEEIDVSDIVFKIGPRINASGRLDHAKASVELLLSQSLKEAKERAESVEYVNAARKNFDENITKEALHMIRIAEKIGRSKSTVLYKEDWHKGVIGIVASRCIETYYRPTIILTKSNNKATGSARSVSDFDIYEAINECSEFLEQFGGHKYAAGLTLEIENVPAFQDKFEEVVSQRIQNKHSKPVLEIDDEIFLDQINYRFFKILKQMAPFGPGNPDPIFVARNVFADNLKILKDKHLRFDLFQDGQQSSLVCIAFGMANSEKYKDKTYFNMLEGKMRFNIAFEIKENTFRDCSSLQLFVKDINFD